MTRTAFYVTIDNRDGRLDQTSWALLTADLQAFVSAWAFEIHGTWFSWQSVCAHFDVMSDSPDHIEEMRAELRLIAERWRQDGIAFVAVDADAVEYLRPSRRSEARRACRSCPTCHSIGAPRLIKSGAGTEVCRDVWHR